MMIPHEILQERPLPKVTPTTNTLVLLKRSRYLQQIIKTTMFLSRNAIKWLPTRMGFEGSDVRNLTLVTHLLVIAKRLFPIDPC